MATTSTQQAKCHKHRAALAGWRCDTCQQYLCPACAARIVNHYYCCECDAQVARLTLPRASRPFIVWVVDAVTYPVRRGILGLLGMATVITLLSHAAPVFLDPSEKESRPKMTASVATAAVPAEAAEAPELPPESEPSAADLATDPPGKPAAEHRLSEVVFPPLRAVILFSYLFLVVAARARGGRIGRSAFSMTAKAFVATAVLWISGAVHLLGTPPYLTDGRALDDGMTWLFVGLGIVYLPMAMAATATEATVRELLNPFRLFEWAGRVGRRYGMTVGLVALLGGVAYAIGHPELRETIPVPLAADILAEAVSLLAFVPMARLTGSLIYVHGRAWDWGTALEFHDPILPTEAQGTRKRKESATPVDGVVAGAAAGANGPRDRPEPLLAKDVIRALDENNLLRALKLYGARPEWSENAFNGRQLLELGTGAVRVKNYDLAEKALVAATEKPGLFAGRAMIALARIYEQLEREPRKTWDLYRQVAEKFPNTDMARTAAQKLGA